MGFLGWRGVKFTVGEGRVITQLPAAPHCLCICTNLLFDVCYCAPSVMIGL